MTIPWAAIKVYAKRYWWIAVLAMVVYLFDTISGTIHDYLAYKNPQVKMIVVTKVQVKIIEKRNIITERIIERRPDGTTIEKIRTEDKSIFDTDRSTDTVNKTEKKPIFYKTNGISSKLSFQWERNKLLGDIYTPSYTAKWRRYSLGVSRDFQDGLDKENIQDGIKVKASIEF